MTRLRKEKKREQTLANVKGKVLEYLEAAFPLYFKEIYFTSCLACGTRPG